MTNAILGDRVILRPKGTSRLLWIELTIEEARTLDMMPIRVEDAARRSHPLLGFGIGRRTDGGPFIDYCSLEAPGQLDGDGPYGLTIYVNVESEGPSIGKVLIDVDLERKKSVLTVRQPPTVISMLFAVPRASHGLTLKGVLGRGLPVAAP